MLVAFRHYLQTFACSCCCTVGLAMAPLESLGANGQEVAKVSDHATHYRVVLDFDSGASHREIGEQYGQQIRLAAPQFESLLDSYIDENAGNWLVYKILMRRIRQIRPQIPQQYRDEIEGIASALSGGTTNIAGDGKISADELYLFNLMGDVARMNQCCALAVFGERSATGTTIVGRNFDWPDGKSNQLTQLQAVITVKNGSQSITNVACLGFQGAVSAFNSAGVFASVLDSPTGAKYSAKKRRSYLMDLRQALENCNTLDTVADFMIDPAKLYAFNHSIILADATQAVVLENNLSGKGHNIRRALRRCDSQLRPGEVWDVSEAIGCVNSFELEGNDDNHIDPADRKSSKSTSNIEPDINTPRWESMKEQLKLHNPAITRQDLEEILSFYHPESGGDIYKGDLYNSFTMESIVFEPASLRLEVAFRPRNGKLPAKLRFEPIPLPVAQQESKVDVTPVYTAPTSDKYKIELNDKGFLELKVR